MTHDSRPRFATRLLQLDRAPLQGKRLLLWALGVWLLGVALFAKSIGFGFISLDTATVLLNHPHLYDESSLLGSVYQIFIGYFPREEPLIVRDLTWALDSRLFGFRNPLGYHLGNVLLHACNGVLVLSVVARSTGRSLLALGSALLFAVIPIHVQAVSWEMGRKDVLVAFFVLLALHVQHAALRRAGTPEGRRAQLTLVLLVVLAVLSKLSAIVLCALLALYALLLPYLDGRLGPRDPQPWRAVLRPLAPAFFAQLLVTFVLFRWYGHNLQAVGVLGDRGPPAISAEHLRTLSRYVPISLAKNLQLIAWPYDYSVMYQYPNTNLAPTGAELAIGYAVCALLVGTAIYALLRRRDLLFVLLAFGLLLLPYANLEYIGYWVADRYLYLAALGPVVLLVAGVLALAQRTPRAAPVIAVAFALLCGGYAARAYAHQESYRDNLALWRYEVSVPEPAVWAFASLARETWRRAQAAPAGPERERWVAQTLATIERGLARYRALPLLTTRYRMTERLHAATMHLILGTLAQLQGAPPGVELQHYRAAHALAMTARSALKLADTLLRMAGQAPEAERSPLVRESFRYYAQYLGYVSRDPAARLGALRNLQVYARFPELKADLEALVERELR